MPSEFQEFQRAAGKVLLDVEAARVAEQLSANVALGFRLILIASMLKPEHQPGALKIVLEFAMAAGLDFEVLEQQAQARIYEYVQLDRLEAGAEK